MADFEHFRRLPISADTRHTGGFAVTAGLKRFAARVLVATVCLAIGIAHPPAAADESLGEVRLSLLQTDPGGVTPSNRPRLAVLLIDCSSSMTYGVNGDENMPKSPSNPERWGEMKKGVRSTLNQLLTDSKGIEIRIRFFSDTLDSSIVRDTLDGPDSVDRVMASLDKRRPSGTTVLYQATSEVCQQTIESNRKNHFEWILFGIFSDGKDGTSPSPHSAKSRDAKIEELQAEVQKHDGRLEYLVFTVGPDAKGDYGQAQIKGLNARIPKPPTRPASYNLELAPGQSKFLEIKQPAKPGTYSLAVALADDHRAIPKGGMRLIPSISGGSAMRLASKDLVVDGIAPATLKLEVPAGTDVTKGLSAEITFEPATDASRPFLCSGTAAMRVAFAADELLPREKWQDVFPRAVKRGEPATFFLDPGKATNFTWKFTGPGGTLPPDTPKEKQFERSFDKAGTWTVEYSCTSQADTSKVVSKKLHDLEVVDADFHLDPTKLAVDPGTPATITIVPNKEATSKATYKAELDDASIPLEGSRVVIPGKQLVDDSHFLSVTASVEAGGRTFVFGPHKSVIKVKPGAKIVRLRRGQQPLKPGELPPTVKESIPPGVESVFQVTEIDLTRVDSIEWTHQLPGQQPKKEKTPNALIHLTPEQCGPLVIRANVSMKDVKDLAPVEEHFDVGGIPPSATPKLVPDVTPIRLLGTTVKLDPGIEGTCRRVTAWLVPENATADAPRLWEQTFDPHQKQVQIVVPRNAGNGKYKVHLKAEGFPGCQDWQPSEPLTLTLTPRRKYELWLVSVAGLSGLGWLLYAWLWGNDPLRWWIDFSFNDPGPPTTDGGGSYTLYVGEAAPASAGHRTNYLGWNRWRKQAFVPLWLFAERADSADGSWLNDPRWAETTLKIVNAWKNPFKLTGDLGVNWKSEVRYNDLEGAEPISRTLWLQPPWDGAGAPPAVWMRMHCPRGGDPHLWFLWTWIAVTFVAAALLLPYFNIVTL